MCRQGTTAKRQKAFRVNGKSMLKVFLKAEQNVFDVLKKFFSEKF